MPTFNWGSDAIAVDAAGCTITWTDIDPDTWLSDRPVSQHSGVLALDTFGSVDTNDYHENTVYDATHSLGAKGVGSRGVAECFSLAATKPVTGGGEGGFITTNDLYIAQKCTELRDLCSRIPEMSCVVALEYLSHLDEMLAAKKKIAKYYRKHLPYQFQEIPHDSTYSKICFLCDNSTELIARAAKNGVECRKYYKPLHDMPHSTDVYNRIVCLPSWCGVDVKRVVAAIETIS
jgi:dTDP-4-amino-4,6-dideoxygalactose transaminase